PAHSTQLIAGYEILRTGPRDKDFKPIFRIRSTASQQVSYTDKGLLDLTEYAYRVRAVSKYGLVSDKHAEAAAVTAGQPPRVQGLQAESGRIRNVPLEWKPSSDPHVTGYIVKRSGGGGKDVLVARLQGRETSAYVDKGLTGGALKDGETYTYRVVAFNSAEVESEPSEAVKAATRPPPSAVVNAAAKSGMPKQVEISWQASVEQEEIETYNVYRSDRADGDWAFAGKTSGRLNTTCLDGSGRGRKLENGRTYFYCVAAINVGGVEGARSRAVSATTKASPAKVAGVAATSGSVKGVPLRWRANREPDIKEYQVYRAFGSGSRFSAVGTVEGGMTEYADAHLSDGTQYSYRIAAVDADGLEGEMSDPVSATTKPAPEAPAGLKFRDLGGSIELTWDANKEPDVEKYLVQQRGFAGGKRLGESQKPTYVVEGLKAGGSYTFSVVAVDGDGLQSAPSAPLKCILKKAY
ncbi:MAG: fibronectin type III domain-containing protein, partial [Kiritimatiellae bacterium]|nr:fibronectin type III domain-containing protein [Kiritimatiellia bacterium]